MDINPLPMSVQTAQRVDYWADKGDTYRAIAQFIQDEGYVKPLTGDAAEDRAAGTITTEDAVAGAIEAERWRISALIIDAAEATTSKALHTQLRKIAQIIAGVPDDANGQPDGAE